MIQTDLVNWYGAGHGQLAQRLDDYLQPRLREFQDWAMNCGCDAQDWAFLSPLVMYGYRENIDSLNLAPDLIPPGLDEVLANHAVDWGYMIRDLVTIWMPEREFKDWEYLYLISRADSMLYVTCAEVQLRLAIRDHKTRK